MRPLFAAITAILIGTTAQADPYLALSFGTSLEKHDFDIQAAPATRRMVTGRDASADVAFGLGWRDAVTIAGRSFDAELEVFERRNNRFSANAAAGTHPTAIKTTSVMLAAWTDITSGSAWALQAGAGIGARHSSYRMTGPGVNIRATDRAPYAMLGVRYTRRTGMYTRLFADARLHARPPVSASALGTVNGPLEHESQGLTLRFGVQIDLDRRLK